MPTGHYLGRNIPTIETAMCRTCGLVFTYKRFKCTGERQFCTQGCHMKFEREKRRKVPEHYELLYDLYWNQNKTTIEIGAIFNTDHSVVKARMKQLNIPRRKPGHSRHTICIIEGCSRPVYKKRHSTNGSLHGRRCFLHWVEMRHQWTVNNWKNVRSQKPERLERIKKAEIQKRQRRQITQWKELLHKLRTALKEQNHLALQSLEREFAQAKTSQI